MLWNLTVRKQKAILWHNSLLDIMWCCGPPPLFLTCHTLINNFFKNCHKLLNKENSSITSLKHFIQGIISRDWKESVNFVKDRPIIHFTCEEMRTLESSMCPVKITHFTVWSIKWCVTVQILGHMLTLCGRSNLIVKEGGRIKTNVSVLLWWRWDLIRSRSVCPPRAWRRFVGSNNSWHVYCTHKF